MFLNFQTKVTNAVTNAIRDSEIVEGKRVLKKQPKKERPVKRKAPVTRATRQRRAPIPPRPRHNKARAKPRR